MPSLDGFVKDKKAYTTALPNRLTKVQYFITLVDKGGDENAENDRSRV